MKRTGLLFLIVCILLSAFNGCKVLSSITIPNGIKSIGSSTFYGCSSLTSIVIPASVTSIGGYAFYGCAGTLYVNCDIPSATDSYGGAFYASKFTNVRIGAGVRYIGDRAFQSCSTLVSVSIPESVEYIGNYAFYDCI